MGVVNRANQAARTVYRQHGIAAKCRSISLGLGRLPLRNTGYGSWSKDTVTTWVSTDLKWRVTLKTPDAGGPYKLCIMGKDTITLENIMIGEVWLCSGQSNMELTAEQTFNNSELEVANAYHPNIRLFNVKRTASQAPQENCFGEWEVCSPRSMRSFSALGYFFGRHLHQHLNIPVGLINASLGGTPAEVGLAER